MSDWYRAPLPEWSPVLRNGRFHVYAFGPRDDRGHYAKLPRAEGCFVHFKDATIWADTVFPEANLVVIDRLRPPGWSPVRVATRRDQAWEIET